MMNYGSGAPKVAARPSMGNEPYIRAPWMSARDEGNTRAGIRPAARESTKHRPRSAAGSGRSPPVVLRSCIRAADPVRIWPKNDSPRISHRPTPVTPDTIIRGLAAQKGQP